VVTPFPFNEAVKPWACGAEIGGNLYNLHQFIPPPGLLSVLEAEPGVMSANVCGAFEELGGRISLSDKEWSSDESVSRSSSSSSEDSRRGGISLKLGLSRVG
jgi:hypothetical protein